MRAIRVAKRNRKGNLTGKTTAHWLLDDDRTYCGRVVSEMRSIEHVDVERLDAVEACHGCVRFADGWTKNPPGRIESEHRVTSESQPGRMRTTGPLNHGTAIRRSSRRV